MARLEWDTLGSRYYNAGLDRGVLYVGGEAVPWNGLISVEEQTLGGEISPIYQDGIRIRNIPNSSEYSAVLTAFFSPPEFDQCEGILESPHYGFYITNQTQKSFGLSYRTGHSNDIGEKGYKIHIVYNAMVEPRSTTYNTLNSSSTASNLSWTIKAVPMSELGSNFSAHYVFDTTKIDNYVVEAIEDVLYGSSTRVGRLPTIKDINDVMINYWRLKVTDTNNGNFEISGTDYAVKKVGDAYQIASPTMITHPEYFEIMSS